MHVLLHKLLLLIRMLNELIMFFDHLLHLFYFIVPRLALVMVILSSQGSHLVGIQRAAMVFRMLEGLSLTVLIGGLIVFFGEVGSVLGWIARQILQAVGTNHRLAVLLDGELLRPDFHQVLVQARLLEAIFELAVV